MPSRSRKQLECCGNACPSCGYCRDWKHSGRNWYRNPNATCNDYRYWHYNIYRYHPAVQREIGARMIKPPSFHRGYSGHHIIFGCPTHIEHHPLCECMK
ncbi:unnamed protein product [Adineta steineri]|uniref:Uncharacterized protein n=1 Tax=Adineta steineri TaxID=433720 RepID=A0A814VC51_9BILA|nr:unnamed protein product [Adineta steineri]CAF3773816.1 unnamed protein product [Adineta steineri]